jgi:uncharacterized membrane protein YGL010W
MRNATELMVSYAAYHRDQRNIATHAVGIPLIIFSIGVLLARPAIEWHTLTVSPAWVLWVITTLWYLTRGNLMLAIAVSAMNFLLIALAQPVGALTTALWLTVGLGSFVIGWLIQFIGHYYEGRKPAFVDDITGLFVGPMFVAAEGMFATGWGRPLAAEIVKRVGPTHLRDLHAHATRAS